MKDEGLGIKVFGRGLYQVMSLNIFKGERGSIT